MFRFYRLIGLVLLIAWAAPDFQAAQTPKAQGDMNQKLQVELTFNAIPSFENECRYDICLSPNGFLGIDSNDISSKDLKWFLELRNHDQKHLVLSVDINPDEIPMKTLARAVSDVYSQRDPVVSTHVFFSMRQFFDEEALKEMTAPKSKGQKLQMSFLLEMPNAGKESKVFLSKEGLVDIKNNPISYEDLCKALRSTGIKNGQKECILYVLIKKDAEFEISTLAKAVTRIYAQIDPDLRTHAFILFQDPGK